MPCLWVDYEIFLMCTHTFYLGYYDLSLSLSLSLFYSLPRFLLILGSLRVKVHQWLLGCGKKHCDADCCSTKMMLLESFYDFPKRFISCHQLVDAFVTYDDEDLDAWGYEAKRWTRVFFLVIKEEQDLVPILKVAFLSSILIMLFFLLCDFYFVKFFDVYISIV